MISKSDKDIIEYKKNIFLREVRKAAISLGVNVPEVEFWPHYENHFNKGERAHIHIEENKICIAEPELEIMTEEEIIETATHEVSHLHYLNHGWEFQKTQKDLEIASWEPPSGTVGALPEGYVRPKEKKRRNKKPIKYKCNFCGKKTKTKRCKFCNGYFCEEHIKPEEPFIGHPMNEDRAESKNTHICSFSYSRYLDEQKKKKKEEYSKALDRLSDYPKRKAIKENNIFEKDLDVFDIEPEKKKNIFSRLFGFLKKRQI